MMTFQPDGAGAPRCFLSIYGLGAPDILVEPPRFTWKVTGLSGRQEAYRLLVSSDERLLAEGKGDLWDSGWVESAESAQIPYGGAALVSNRDYFAAVQVKPAEGAVLPASEPSRFSTGLLGGDEWAASWLIASVPTPVMPLFRKAFRLREKPRRARLFLCGLGYYEAWLNGARVGDRMLDPAWTDYGKRVNYTAYQVTELLEEDNALGVMLGCGWYANDEGTPRPTFTAWLVVEYADGTQEHILTRQGDGWLSHSDGPIRSASLYIGEVYDARKEKAGWCEAGFDPGSESVGRWLPAIEAEPPAGKLLPMEGEPIRVVGQVAAVSVTPLAEEDTYVVDFGQNLAGVPRLRMNLPADREVRIRYAEILAADGRLNTANLRSAQQADLYITKGGGETYQPRFTYHGFRYAEVAGVPDLAAEDITALVVRNDVAVHGEFSCANPLLNQIQQNCVWTESNNLHSVPTDCPQRDERLGWLNDLTVRAEEAVYNFDMSRFYRKFLLDIADAQGPVTGAITDTVPYNRYGGQPADAVCSSYLILPWLLHRHYGDRQVLETHYNGLAAWVGYLCRQREDGIVAYSYYGDWASPIAGAVADSYGSGAVSQITPGPLMSTGYLYMNARIMADMAAVLGRAEDAARYDALAEESREALNRVYLNKEQGYYGENSQASNVFMLYLGIVPPDYRERVVANLVRDIRERDIHLTTGNLCSRYILDVLADNGHIDLAYALAAQTTYPSWGYMVEKGATTTWERWEYVEDGPLIGMASHDHPMYATISGWFYSYLLGIRPLEPGYGVFRWKPYIPRELEAASGSVKTVKGDISAAWKQGGGSVELRISVPFNTICRLVLPGLPKAICNGKATQPEVVDGEAVLLLEPGDYRIEPPLAE